MESLRPRKEPAGTDKRALVVLCTCSNQAEAGSLARGLLDQGLAACVNVLPQIRSIYRWQDEIRDEPESLMVIKTSQESYEALQSWLEKQHSYEVPEILALPVEQGLPAYLAWLLSESGRG